MFEGRLTQKQEWRYLRMLTSLSFDWEIARGIINQEVELKVLAAYF